MQVKGAFKKLAEEDVWGDNSTIDMDELKKGLRKLGVHPRKMLEKNYADV